MPAGCHSPRRLRYRLLVFVASFLLFEIELIVGRLLLPSFGSSASVWMTCLMYFQGALLVGYLWGARAQRWIDSGRYRWAHVIVAALPAVTFPLRIFTAHVAPVLSVCIALTIAVALPFVVLSTTSVIAQAWLARSDSPDAGNPWFLYGMSNAGAFAALLAYPLVIEPSLDTHAQLWGWYGGYALFVVLVALSVPRGSTERRPHPGPLAVGEGSAGQLSWLLFPMGANALLMAATHAITLDASVPLLWVVPLAVYLLTLILVFSRRPLTRRQVNIASGIGLTIAVAALAMVNREQFVQLSYVVLNAVVLFIGCLLLHWHLSEARPKELGSLGRYYFSMALGGWLGSVAIVLLVPVLFRHVAVAYLDYVVAGVLVVSGFIARDARRIVEFARAKPVPTAIIVLALAFVGTGSAVIVTAAPKHTHKLEGVRSFYGLYNVKDEGGLRWFHHGNTVHGVESLDPAHRGEPLAYYDTHSPIAEVLEAFPEHPHVALVGLGVGTLAAYSKPGERWEFFELDPEVDRLARAHFDFLANARGEVQVVYGDARLTLAATEDHSYDLIVLDAFSSDFVPTHLITREAFELYERKLRPGGLIVCHISNRIFDLTPVLARVGKEDGLYVAAKTAFLRAPEDFALGHFASRWVAMTRSDVAAAKLISGLGWTVPTAEMSRRPWTDSYVNLFQALR